MTMITPSYLGETIEYSSLHACRSTLEDPTYGARTAFENSNPQWRKLFEAKSDSPERLVSVELLTEMTP